ncbi:MAG: hypothetical protein J7K08_06185 [Thermoplasmata archaeon]|nr:hypothetical protein [Thermoplasmata archaeon]
MGSSEEIIRSIVEMLNEKFNERKKVTVQRVFDKYSTKLVRGRDITLYLFRIGIIKPRREGESPKTADLWEINLENVRAFLENGGALLDIRCPLCGGQTISNSYNTYRCTKCFYQDQLPPFNPYIYRKNKNYKG